MLPNLARHTEKLLYFYEILHEGSMQATSRKLNLSAATLSYSVKELEETTGVVLLNRSKKGVTATPAGERLYEFCRRLFKDLDQIQNEITDLNHPARRKIRIGTFSSIAIYFWPYLKSEIKNDEALSVSITTKRSKEILEALVKKDIEVAITVGSFQHSNLVTKKLYSDTYSFFCAPSSKVKTISKINLESEVLLFIPNAECDEGKDLKYYLHHYGLKFKSEFELDSFEVIAEFIRKGYGIGILPNLVAKNLGSKLKKLNVESIPAKGFGEHGFYLSHRGDSEMNHKDLGHIIGAAQSAVKKLTLNN
jgi:DNA-binding transcriptional LysR family regulator